ncbi:MAG: DMT family transporter [Nitriliruptoraceae bacterium]
MSDARPPATDDDAVGATRPGARVLAFLAVVVAAAMWGTDGVLRGGLALELPAATVVAHEHLLLTLFTLPWLPRAIRTFRGLRPAAKLSIVLIGGGASAAATTLFTLSFTYGDPTTPLLLQKLQPVIAVLGASLLLGERPTRRFVPLAAIAFAGGYLLSFPDPLAVSVDRLAPALLAVSAAALWAGGTVLGRAVAPDLATMELTTLRFSIGLPFAASFVWLQLGPSGFAITSGDVLPLVALALGPGLLAMTLYYRGLAGTPASLATFGELAFPLTAVALGGLVAGQTLTMSQVVGLVILLSAITALALATRARPLVRQPRAPLITPV